MHVPRASLNNMMSLLCSQLANLHQVDIFVQILCVNISISTSILNLTNEHATINVMFLSNNMAAATCVYHLKKILKNER